jgi:surface polysaccharide O-acyltransferase-like enzyme
MAKKDTNVILQALPVKEERNMGVELFRVVSMMMVVMLHVLGHGGVYSHAGFLTDNYKVAWFLEAMAYCSVNCYALISGFANVKSGFKFRRIIYLWLEVVTLNVALTAVMHFFVPSAEVTADYWLRAFFPLVRRAFWYFCAYFFMFPLIPILNKGILSLKKNQHIIICFMLMAPSVFRVIMKTDNYVLGSGYSAIWLVCLYVIGAYFRIYGAPKWAKWFVTVPAFFGATFVAWYYKIRIENMYAEGLITKDSELYSNRGLLISYISPCMVIMAVALLLIFMKIQIKRKTPKLIISNLGKATFGVFILHVGAAFWYWKDFWSKFNAYAKYPTWKMVLAVLLTVCAIYLGFSLISIGRIYLFKLLRIHKIVDGVVEIFQKDESK